MEHPENNPEYAGLQVNSGVEQQSIVNPYLQRNRFKRRELSVGEMVEGILKGNVTILSQAVTLIESVNPAHQQKAQEVIEKCLPYSGNSIRVGISGVPGAGKSTSIDEFGMHILKEKGGKLAVLAIDPSSERTKGSILGDKTRMEKLALHPDSFIRPAHRQALWEVLHARLAKLSFFVRLQAMTRFSLKRLEWVRAKRHVTRWLTSSFSYR